MQSMLKRNVVSPDTKPWRPKYISVNKNGCIGLEVLTLLNNMRCLEINET